MICSACNNAIEGEEDYLSCTRCDKLYHLICTGLQAPKNVTNIWVCPECQCANKRGGDNSFTPVGPSQDPNVTLRRKAMTNSPLFEYNERSDLICEMNALRSEMSGLKELLTKALSLVSSHEDKLQKYALQVEQLNKRLEKYENSSLNNKYVTQTQPKTSIATTAVGTNIGKRNEKVTKMDIAQITSPNLITNFEPSPMDLAGTQKTAKGSESTPTAVQNNDDNTETEWKLVKRRNPRRPTPLHGSADPAVINLKAVETRKFLHLWNMASGIEDVRQYVNQLCPTGTNTVEELTPRGDYKSYKVGIAAEYWDTCYCNDVWPMNAKIKPWVHLRRPTRTIRTGGGVSGASNVSQQQSFRGTISSQS
ncbi:unnamed protein product [Spodoptera littoralis]|uniref:PHD-type domain-containing protein n=1 Tax=Spodoptera littoralis TaxID=7109 RepID=A0A9P0N5U8_SPOLI|nr:unnamed protein product [Spodoptera littoralis]CAH1642619.1 unnamed protein product [Spodoptera littoralis]